MPLPSQKSSSFLDHLTKRLCECEKCSGTGYITSLGNMPTNCERCKYDRALSKHIISLFKLATKNPFKTYPVGISITLFILTLLFFIFWHNNTTFTILISTFGIIFVALKYKLDVMNYHRNLFKKRYLIFTTINDLLLEYSEYLYQTIPTNEWRQTRENAKEKLDSIYRESYFLYGTETYKFLEQFRESMIYVCWTKNDLNLGKENLERHQKFLISLLEGQNLSKHFIELKIDKY